MNSLDKLKAKIENVNELTSVEAIWKLKKQVEVLNLNNPKEVAVYQLAHDKGIL